MVRNRPRYESERKAPTRGKKLVAAVQKKSMFCPCVNPMLYSCIKYIIMLGTSPRLATFSNASFAVHQPTKLNLATKKNPTKSNFDITTPTYHNNSTKSSAVQFVTRLTRTSVA